MGLKEVRKCGEIVMDEQLDIEFKRKAYDKILEWEKRAPDYAYYMVSVLWSYLIILKKSSRKM